MICFMPQFFLKIQCQIINAKYSRKCYNLLDKGWKILIFKNFMINKLSKFYWSVYSLFKKFYFSFKIILPFLVLFISLSLILLAVTNCKNAAIENICVNFMNRFQLGLCTDTFPYVAPRIQWDEQKFLSLFSIHLST